MSFWGGREGYQCLLEHGHETGAWITWRKFLHMAVDFAKEIGFDRAHSYIEPKPKEPTKHQYDSDAAAACLNFLSAIRPAPITSS